MALYAAGAEGADVSKAEAFARADVLISDVSGVTAEFLFTEKPTILPVTSTLASLSTRPGLARCRISMGLPLADDSRESATDPTARTAAVRPRLLPPTLPRRRPTLPRRRPTRPPRYLALLATVGRRPDA